MIQEIDDVHTVCCLLEETSKTIPAYTNIINNTITVSANRLYNNQYLKIIVSELLKIFS